MTTDPASHPSAATATDVRPIHDLAESLAKNDLVMAGALATSRKIYGVPAAARQQKVAKEARVHERLSKAEADAAKAVTAAARKQARADKLKARQSAGAPGVDPSKKG